MADHTAPSLPLSCTPPLVGRGREQAILRDALNTALAGRGSLVLIGGEAGIGKTALAEAMLAEATAQGALVLVGRCYDLSETPPYGPWREALARAPCGPTLPPDLAAIGLPGQAAHFAAVRDCLAGLTARQSLVLLLEDLHWADHASLDLLRALARDIDDLPLLVLATYRAEEVARGHPLYALLPLLVHEAAAARLDLHPLNAAAIDALAMAHHPLHDADRARLVAYLIGRTEGNPLFLRELLRTLQDEGLLVPAGERWAVGDLERTPVPPLLRQVIVGRVARLGPETERLLAAAAVIGQEVPLTLWAAVAGTDEDGLLDAVEQALGAHLLVADDDGEMVRFAHALVREALHAEVATPRRRVWHRRAAEALLATPIPDPDAVAYHLLQAGDPRASDWLIKAGDRAQRAYALLTTAARYEAALTLLTRHGANLRERGWLLVVLAHLRRYADPAGARPCLEEASRLATEAGDSTLAAYAQHLGGVIRGMGGAFGAGVEEMAAGVAAFDALPQLIAPPASLADTLEGVGRYDGILGRRLHPDGARAQLVAWLALAGRYAEAAALAGRLPGTPVVPIAAGYVAVADGLAHAAQGRPEEARRAFAEARRSYHAAGHHVMDGWTAAQELCWVALPYGADRLVERHALAQAAEEAWQRASAAQTRHVAALAHLPLRFVEGRWDERPDENVAILPAYGGPWSHVRPWLARLARERGAAALAWRLVRESLPEGQTTAPPGQSHFLHGLAFQRLASALALDDGDRPLARAWLEAHDRWLAGSGVRLGRAEGALAWAAYHQAVGEVGEARALAERALAHAGEPHQPLALLAAHRLLGELATEAGCHAHAADQFDAALALADACAAPFERALTLLALAELQADTGARGPAGATLAEARRILAPLWACLALARADALAVRLAAPAGHAASTLPYGLTAREAAVLKLLAAGLTDHQIGARLFVSRNTVASHSRAIYGKLGVNTRAAAARLAAEHGLA